MTELATVNWYHPGKRRNVDGSGFPPNTEVEVVSRNHPEAPTSYRVYECLPKPFWKFWGRRREIVSPGLQAFEDGPVLTSPGGRFRSEPWNLGEPSEQSGTATFVAESDREDGSSGPLHSRFLRIKELHRRHGHQGEVGVGSPAPVVTLKARAGGYADVQEIYVVETIKDPDIEISVLQGEDVYSHLLAWDREYRERFQASTADAWHLSEETITRYFVDRPMGDASVGWQLLPNEPLTIILEIPDRFDLRAAFCLKIVNTENGRVSMTPPRFLAHIRDTLVATDLTADLLDDEAALLLWRFDQLDFNVQALADEARVDPDAAWLLLVDATELLGAPSVAEAASVIGFGMPQPARA
jgi:hypothetical protein